MPQSILVIGGTGNTGRHIVQKLPLHSYTVRVLARDVRAAREQFDSQVEIVSGDITHASSVTTAMRDMAGCVIIVESSSSDSTPNSPEQVHYEGTRHVLAAAGEQMAHMILVTQIYITRPDRYPEVGNIIHWRRLAEQAVRASSVPYTIVRPSWLTDEPGGREAIRFEQGDTGDGQISREDEVGLGSLQKSLTKNFLLTSISILRSEVFNACIQTTRMLAMHWNSPYLGVIFVSLWGKKAL